MSRIARIVALWAILAWSPAARAADADPAPAIEEVHVGGQRAGGAKGERIGASEIKALPGVFGDPFRAIEVLPGVVPIASGVPFYFIRGSPPGNTGYFLDGIAVPALFHVGVGPSIVHPALVDRVDLHPGPVPAQYGRYAAGVVTATLRPLDDEAHAEAALRLFDASAFAETPLDGGRASALAAVRYGYPGLVLPIFAPDVRLSYWDYQTRETYALTDRDTASVFAFGTSDSLAQRDSSGRLAEQLGFTFHRVDLRFDHSFADAGRLRSAVTFGTDQSGQEGLEFDKQLVGTRLEIDRPLSDAVRVRAGWDALYAPYQTVTSDPGIAARMPPRKNFFAGAWADASLRPWRWVELVPGVRGDVYTSLAAEGLVTQAAIDPRLVVRTSLSNNVTLVSSAAVAHQPPSTLVSLPGFEVGPLSDGLQEATPLSQGVEAKLPAGFFASLTGFHDTFRGMSDASFSCASAASIASIASCSGSYLSGRAFGAEVLVRRAMSERVSGLLSYTLSRSVRNDPRWFGSGREIPSRFDRPHVFNLVLVANLGRGWSAGGRVFAYSGNPYSRAVAAAGADYSREVPPYDAQRFDAFTRVDLRLEKNWRLASGVRVAVFAEMLNALVQKESLGVKCNWGTTTLSPDGHTLQACTPIQVGPIAVPSVGIQGAL